MASPILPNPKRRTACKSKLNNYSLSHNGTWRLRPALRRVAELAMPSDATFARRGAKNNLPGGAYRNHFENRNWLAELDHLLFSLNGRATRLQYWIVQVAYTSALYFIIFVCRALGKGLHDVSSTPAAATALVPALLALLLILVVFAMVVWASFAIHVKRWHDRDKSWTWALLGFVPIVGWLWQSIECGYLDGTLGPNRFGPSPKGITGVVYGNA